VRRGFAYRMLVGSPEVERSLGTLMLRWEDNIKIYTYLREIGWGGMDSINLAEDRDQWRAFVNPIKTFRFNKILGNF
jgi:hypothetical protein